MFDFTNFFTAIASNIGCSPYSLVLTFFISSILSGLPIIGSILPASSFHFILSVTAIKFGFTPFFLACFIIPGIVLGDSLGFLCGNYYMGNIKQWKFYKKRKKFFNKSEIYFERFGGIAIVFARIAGPFRTVMPICYGVIGGSYKKFLFYDFCAALLWSLTHLTVGYFIANPFFWNKMQHYIPWL